jgi:predicted transposase/invertase (TIGR01784 family)
MYKSVFEEVYTERGVQEGEAKTRVEVAKNFLADGISPDIVAKNTGLSKTEIQALMN